MSIPSTLRLSGLATTLLLAADASAATTRVTLLGLNDLHGNIEAKTAVLGAGPTAKSTKVGGASVMAAYFDIARQDNPRTLVLDSGDAYQGTLLSNFFEGLPVVEAYNVIGVNASTFGNHEFDYGDLNEKPEGHPQGAMRRLLKAAKFPYLSTNVVSAGQRKLEGFENVRPSKIFDLQGVKVGIIGTTTESTPKEAAPPSIQGLEFKKMAEAVEKESKRLRAAGAQVVALISHAGGRCDMTKPAEQGDEACKGDKPDEITALIEALPKGTLDAVLAGHVHQAQAHFIRGVPVVQTYGFGTSFSRIDLFVGEKGVERAEIARPTYFCHEHFAAYASCSPDEAKLGGAYPADFGQTVAATYLGQPVKPRADADAVLEPFQKLTQALIEKHLVDLPGELTHDRTVESPISNCVADAIHEQVEHETGRKADVFVSHSGGIRTKLPKVVRFGDVFAVLPFDGAMAFAKLTGEELEEFGRIQSLTPKSISVLSGTGWKVKLAEKPVFPRHRGFVTPAGEAPQATELYTILTEEFNVLPGGQTDALLTKARAEGRIDVLQRLSRDLFADRLTRPNLPQSCLGGALDRTLYVP